MPNANQRAITLRFLAEPSDVNFGGNVHGGAVMKWIDHAGYTCAAMWSASDCVTAKEYAVHMIDLRQQLEDQSEAFFREFDRSGGA